MLLDGLLTPKQAAERAGIHERTLRKWCQTGRLKAVHQFPGPTGMKLFRPADVDAAARPEAERAS